jgi:ribose transport system substrate-binding protein
MAQTDHPTPTDRILATSALTRRKFLRRGLIGGGGFALLAGSGLILAACDEETADTTASPIESTTPSPTTPPTWAVMNQFFTLENAYFKGWDEAQTEVAQLLGMTSERQVDNFNPEAVLTAFENAARTGVDAITTRILDTGLSRTLLDIATDAEMFVQMAWAVAPWISPFDVGPYFNSFTTPNNVAGTEATCNALFDRMGGSGKLIQITGVPGDPVEVERSLGVDRALANYSNVEMVAKQTGNWSRGGTTEVIEALLTANPDVSGVFCQNDDMGVGAIAALRSRDMEVPVAAIDAIPDFVDLIANDPARAFATWTTTSGGGPWLGAWLIVQAFDALSGVELRAPERMMYAGGFVLDTPEAAEAYTELMFTDSGSYPFDYERWSKALHPNDWDPQTLLRPIDYPEFFSLQGPAPDGYEVSQDFVDSKESGEFDAVAQEYEEHFQSDPFSEIRGLVNYGDGQDIV